MRSVTEGIHHISLANNELKSLTSRFVTTFSQLRGKGQPSRFATATSKRRGHSREPPGCCGGDTALESFPTAVFAPLRSHLNPSSSSAPPPPPPKNPFFLYHFQPLQEEGTGFALTHLSQTHALPLPAVAWLLRGHHPSKDGAGDEKGWEKQPGHDGAWQRWGISGCRRHAGLLLAN